MARPPAFSKEGDTLGRPKFPFGNWTARPSYVRMSLVSDNRGLRSLPLA